jgi:autotransporter-associated beta strand protein
MEFDNSAANVAFSNDAPTTLTLTGGFDLFNLQTPNIFALGIGDPDAAGLYKTSLVKNGSGTWQVTNANNTYSGGTTINGGMLLIDSGFGTTSSGLGTGPIVINGGTLWAQGGYIFGQTTVNAGGSIGGPFTFEHALFLTLAR